MIKKYDIINIEDHIRFMMIILNVNIKNSAKTIIESK